MSYPHSRRSRVSQRRIAEFYPYHSKRECDALKREARRAVEHALRIGTLKKQSCQECDRRLVEAHHDDYAQPLDVIWLCRHHHRHRDADLRDTRRNTVARIAKQPLARLQLRSYRSRITSDSAIALVRQATLEIADVLDAEGASENLLASRMKVSRQVINSQFAGGFRTLKLLAAYADALGYEAAFVLKKRPEQESAVAS